MRLIDADRLKTEIDLITNDPACPLFVAAEIYEAIATAPAIPQWTKINSPEDLPPNRMNIIGTYVNPTGKKMVHQMNYWTKDGNWYHGTEDFIISGVVTHWMPLPEPPKGDEA